MPRQCIYDPELFLSCFPSALYWRRVFHLIVLIIFSESEPRNPDFCLIFIPYVITMNQKYSLMQFQSSIS
jgi:hypothetical protein